ncbi:hypothetical protein [Garciella nitratireducens]|uniref:hypothetical protein n=1 Tax=Garciella nitratireducens TaxID=218205 RepID=UPI001BD51AB8|nr:hypothetical protein [Garciella nitratireducens]
MTRKRKKKKKFFLFSIILLFLIISLALLLWRPKSKINTVTNSQILQEIQNSLYSKGKVVLTQQEVNILLEEYQKEKTKKEDFTVETIEIQDAKNNFCVHTTMESRGISFLITTQGQLFYEEPFIEYKIQKVYLGKLPIPKELFFMILNKEEQGKIVIEKETLKIDKKYLFLPIDSLKVQEGKLILKAEIKENLREKNLEKPSKKFLDQETIDELDKILKELDNFKQNLQKEEQRKKVENIQKSIEAFFKNPNQKINMNKKEIKELVDSLSFHEKMEIYSAISSQVNIEELLKKKHQFGF